MCLSSGGVEVVCAAMLQNIGVIQSGADRYQSTVAGDSCRLYLAFNTIFSSRQCKFVHASLDRISTLTGSWTS